MFKIHQNGPYFAAVLAVTDTVTIADNLSRACNQLDQSSGTIRELLKELIKESAIELRKRWFPQN